MQIIQNLQASFNLTEPDLILFASFMIGILVFTFLLGRERVVTVLVCVYIALAIVNFIPEIDNILMDINNNSFWYRIIIFVASVALLFFLLSPTSINSPVESGDVPMPQFVLINILIVGLITSVVLSFMPVAISNDFSEMVRMIFLSLWAKVFWVIIGLVFLAFLSRK